MKKMFRKETKNVIRHYRTKVFDGNALGLIKKNDFDNLMGISSRSVLGRMTAIKAAFCLGYQAGRKELKERIANRFEKGGAA